jgi:TolB-like protein/class 3 adenylate cyclase/Flp pilus assembly protein TadD
LSENAYFYHPETTSLTMPTRRLAAILFADITGYTAMMQRDEEDGMRRLHRFREVLEERVAAHEGKVLQHIGDGSLVVFDSAVEAVACAQEVQIMLQVSPKVPVRIGIHLGDVVMEDGQVYGDGVNLASRVESLGAPGSVLVTDRLMPDLRSHPEFSAVSMGRFRLKNVAEPIEVFAMQGDGIYTPNMADLSEMPIQERKRRLHLTWLLGVAAVAALALLLWWWLPQFSGASTAYKAPDKSIAVLSFKDLSPKGEDTYFAEGIAEEVLNALAQVPDLKVAGRTSSFMLRERGEELTQIGKSLNVGTVLEGSVRRQGKRVRINAQLISTADGYQLWSERYDRELDDIFAIQDEIARAVADELKVILLSEGVKQGTDNREAYEWYLRGRYELSQRSDGVEEARAYFRRALDIDPNFANANAGLGNAYLWLGWNNYLPSREAFPKARQYAEQALAQDSSLAYAHAILGSVNLWYEWKWEQAEEHLRKALELHPSEAAAYLDLGWLYFVRGSTAQGINYASRALSIDPLNLEYTIDLADFYRMSGQYGEAERLAREMADAYPNNSEVYWIQGVIAYDQGRFGEAVTQFEQSVQRSGGDAWSSMYLAAAYAKNGDTKAARDLLDKLEAMPQVAEAAFAEMAPAYWAAGDEEAALKWLQRAYEWHANWMISLKVDPMWNDMRQAPAFQSVVEKMGL